MKYNNFYIKYILPDSILLAVCVEYSQELEFHRGIYKILLLSDNEIISNETTDSRFLFTLFLLNQFPNKNPINQP